MDSCEKYEQMISELIDGELGAAETEELHAHLLMCPSCRELAEAMAAVSAAMREDIVPAPEGFTENVMSRVRSDAGNNKTGGKRRFMFGRFTAMAAILAIIILAAGSKPARRLFNSRSADCTGEDNAAATEYAETYTESTAAIAESSEEIAAEEEAAEEPCEVTGGGAKIMMATPSYAVTADNFAADADAEESEPMDDVTADSSFSEVENAVQYPSVYDVTAGETGQPPALPYNGSFYAVATVRGGIPKLLEAWEIEEGAESELFCTVPYYVIDELWAELGESGLMNIYLTGDMIDPAASEGVVIIYQ